MMTFCKCGGIKGQCSCKATEQPDYRTTTQRGYGNDWTRLSRIYRKQHPLCQRCLMEGKTEPSTQVHHITPIKVDRSMRMKWENLAALCEPCHTIEDDNARHGRPFGHPLDGGVGHQGGTVFLDDAT